MQLVRLVLQEPLVRRGLLVLPLGGALPSADIIVGNASNIWAAVARCPVTRLSAVREW